MASDSTRLLALVQIGFSGKTLAKPFGHGVSHLKLHPSKSWVATNGGARNLQIWDREKGTLNMQFPPRGTAIWFLAWHPERDQIAVARSGGIIELWNIAQVQKELRDLGL